VSDQIEEYLKVIDKETKRLDTFVSGLKTYGITAHQQNHLADIKALLTRDGLLEHEEIALELALYENKVAALAALDATRREDIKDFTNSLRNQINWSAEQENKAFIQISSFSEKLIVVGSGYIAVSVSMLGILATRITAHRQIVGLSLFVIFLVLAILTIVLAAIAQFSANKAAHFTLVEIIRRQHKKLDFDTTLAFSLPMDEALKDLQEFNPGDKISGSRFILRLNFVSVLLLIASAIAFSLFILSNAKGIFSATESNTVTKTTSTSASTQTPQPAVHNSSAASPAPTQSNSQSTPQSPTPPPSPPAHRAP
jgi:hypothetical protein